MKLRHLPSLCAALLALCPIFATAQTSAVPGYISYQGRVVDAAGANVGTGTPVNRTVIFRIWDNPSSTAVANLLYSESQTVTISEGEFSVLVGQGVANVTQTFGYSETDKKSADLGTAFTGSTRYLGVTVAAGSTIATTDNEITPRQQIVSTAFAMRAKFAESIGSSSDLALSPLSGTASNYGLGWYGTDRPFGGTAVDGPVLYGYAGGALGSKVSGSQNTALRWDASGRVGIGATSITSTTNKLTLQGDIATTPGDQLTIRGNTDNNKRLLLGYDTTNNKASLQSYTADSTAGPLLLNPSGGNVGIGSTTAPSVALEVTGAIKASGDLTASSRVMTNSLEFRGVGSPGGALWQKSASTLPTNTSAVNGEMVLMGSPKLHLATANGGAAVMTLSGSNVGIGKADPSVALDVTGAVQASTTIAAGTTITAPTIAAGTTITAGGKSVPTSDEANLKIIRGSVNSSGAVVSGGGFTVTKIVGQNGLYQITFTTAFSSAPSVTATTTGRSNYHAEVYEAGRVTYAANGTDDVFPAATGFTIGINRYDSTQASDQSFSFIAIGPR